MLNNLEKKGILFILSAPSGAGKTTLATLLKNSVPDIYTSISHTTRKPRTGEIDGKDYHFVSTEKFNSMIENGEFIEWANIFGNLYGTSFYNIEMVEKEKKDLLLVIDVQGAQQLQRLNKKGCYIFILPPSLEELKNRLLTRSLDAENVILKRLAKAPDEISHYKSYDYIVINNDVNEAASQLRSIVFAERCRYKNFFDKNDNIALSDKK